MSFARKQTSGVSRSREKLSVPRRVSELEAIPGDSTLPPACDRSLVDGPLPLRFLDNFSILAIHEGEWVKQDALENVVNGLQYAIGRVPLAGAREVHELDWSTSFVVRAFIIEWSLDQHGLLWVRSECAWYQLLTPSKEYAATHHLLQGKVDLINYVVQSCEQTPEEQHTAQRMLDTVTLLSGIQSATAKARLLHHGDFIRHHFRALYPKWTSRPFFRLWSKTLPAASTDRLPRPLLPPALAASTNTTMAVGDASGSRTSQPSLAPAKPSTTTTSTTTSTTSSSNSSSTSTSIGTSTTTTTAPSQRSKKSRDSHKAKRGSSSGSAASHKARSRDVEPASNKASAKALVRQCVPSWLLANGCPSALLCPYCRHTVPLGHQPTVESFHTQCSQLLAHLRGHRSNLWKQAVLGKHRDPLAIRSIINQARIRSAIYTLEDEEPRLKPPAERPNLPQFSWPCRA